MPAACESSRAVDQVSRGRQQRSTGLAGCGGWIWLLQQFEEVRLVDSSHDLFEDVSLGIGDDRGGRGADVVALQRRGGSGIADVDEDGDEARVDRRFDLIVGPDGAFHDSAGDAPLAGEEEDHRLAGFCGPLLGCGVVAGPGDVVGGDVERVPGVGEGNDEEDEPERLPPPGRLFSAGLGCGVGGRR